MSDPGRNPDDARLTGGQVTDSNITGNPDEQFQHRPVMVREVVEWLGSVPAGVVIDTTAGGGGHMAAILDSRADLSVLGIDQDAAAIAAATTRLAPYGDRVTLVRGNFSDLGDIARTHLPEGAPIVGILFDLGVSSPQLDRADRGFTFREDAPLDMRMDDRQATTAADIVNDYDEEDLERVIRDFGEERFARRIARRIVDRRPIMTTKELADAVLSAIPAAARRKGRHPARRTFQAIRMEVNRELESLEAGLDESVHLLAPEGRVLVIAYHSLEDRTVKERFMDWSGTRPSGPMPPIPVTSPPALAKLVKRGAWKPSAIEIEENPRARSARLRALQRAAS
jgi:16S rRNA (cytosine1402-N4)-methyltransferase